MKPYPLLGLALYSTTLIALAGEDSDTFEVTATVDDSCTVTADDLNFGSYEPFSETPLDGTSDVYVQCTKGTDYDVGLSDGEHAETGQRRMIHGTDTDAFLEYELYKDATRETRWDDLEGVNVVEGTGDGTEQSHTVYGHIPAEQNVPAGAYSDTITVTVKW